MRNDVKIDHKFKYGELVERAYELKQATCLVFDRDFLQGEGDVIRDIVLSSSTIQALEIRMGRTGLNEETQAVYQALIDIIMESKTLYKLEVDYRFIADEQAKEFFDALSANTMIATLSIWSHQQGVIDIAEKLLSNTFTTECANYIRNSKVLSAFSFTGYSTTANMNPIIDALCDNSTISMFSAPNICHRHASEVLKYTDIFKKNKSLTYISLNQLYFWDVSLQGSKRLPNILNEAIFYHPRLTFVENINNLHYNSQLNARATEELNNRKNYIAALSKQWIEYINGEKAISLLPILKHRRKIALVLNTQKLKSYNGVIPRLSQPVKKKHINALFSHLHYQIASSLASCGLLYKDIIIDAHMVLISHLNTKDLINLCSLNHASRKALTSHHRIDATEIDTVENIDGIAEYTPTLYKSPPRKYNTLEISLLSCFIGVGVKCYTQNIYASSLQFTACFIGHYACNNYGETSALYETGKTDKFFTGLAALSTANFAYSIYSKQISISDAQYQLAAGAILAALQLHDAYKPKAAEASF